MPIFEIEAHGQRFEVEAPSDTALREAMPRILQAASGQTAPPVTPTGPRTARQGKGSVVTGTDPSQEPSLLARAADVVTGSLRTEFPDAPEFGAAVQGARGSSVWQNIVARGLSAVSPDPRAQVDIIRRAIPDLEEQQDAYGNIMLRAPSLGVNTWAYLNRPGASWRDAAELGAGMAVTAPLIPVMGAGASLVPRIATGALAGAGGSVLQDVAASGLGSEQGIDPTRAIVSAGVGGVLGPLVPRRPTGGAPRAPTAGDESVLAAERLNAGAPGAGMAAAGADEAVQIPRAMASDSHVVQTLGGASQRLPFGSPLEGAAENLTGALGGATERVARGFGGGDAFNAGDAARQAMLDWIRGGSAAIGRRLYGAVERLINPQARLRLGETMSTVNDLALEMAASHGRANRGAVELVLDAINAPAGLTFEGVQRLRTEIGARISGDIVPEAGTAMPALKRIYEALSVDLRRIVNHGGGARAVQAYERAESVHRLIAQRREDLARILGTEGQASPERVIERLIAMARGTGGGLGRADINRLMQARQAMGPAAWNEVASAAVMRLGRAPNGDWSPARFLTDYERLSGAGRDMLFSSTTAGQGGLRAALDDIATISRRFQETMQRYANPSGTGRAVATTLGLGFGVTAPLETMSAALGGYAMANILARPRTADAVRSWMQAQLQAATRPGQATAMLIEQAQRQLWEAMEAEGIQPQRGALQ